MTIDDNINNRTSLKQKESQQDHDKKVGVAVIAGSTVGIVVFGYFKCPVLALEGEAYMTVRDR